MNSDEKDSLLDRYVSGQPMGADEETQVNRLLATDADFRAEYRFRQELFDAGRRERQAAWDARPRVQPTLERTTFPMSWAAAASVVLVLGLGLFWWLRQTDNQPLTGKVPLFEQTDTQLGLTGSDSLAVGMITWTLTKANANEYEFGQPDVLHLFSTSPKAWKDKTWRMTRLSEVRYRLQVGSQIYLLEQGRDMHLPLEPGK